MNLFTFVTLCAFLSTATSQYYYVSQPAYHFQQPTPYNAFAPFSTYHVNPHFQPFQQFRGVPAPHSHFQQFRTVPAPQPAPPPPAPMHRTALARNDDMDYRGFAYHTRTDSGATSHVLFVTGPQAQQVNTRVFNNFNTRAFGQNNEVNQARTVASEMIDSVQKQEEKQNVLPKNIQDLYTPPAMQKVENNDPYQVFQSFFQDTQGPASRLINFYSRNTDLFAQAVPGYPANVVPLPYNTNGLNPSVLQTQNNTDSNNDNEDKKSDIEVAAESIITNTQFRLNDIDDQFESMKRQSTSPPTTVTSLSSTTSTTPEYLESSSISAVESSTSTFEEVTIPSTKDSKIASEDLPSSSVRSIEDGNFLEQRFGNPDTDLSGSESSTSENVSMSVNLRTSEPITSSTESAVLTSTIVTTAETDTDDKITTINTILDSTTEQKSLSTNESEELTTTMDTFESDTDSTTNPLAEIVENESKTTESKTEENSNENISTTENISITTDAMMSTTSQ